MEVALNKSVAERIFHAVLFEVLSNIIIAFSLSYLLKVSLTQSFSLSMTSAIIATLWNYIYNYIFDALQRNLLFKRNYWVRVLHALIFELGLLILLIPACMLLLKLPFLSALYIEIGLVLFFLPYTFIFNLTYDHTRWYFIGKKKRAV